jgi:ABC-2 type transport system ATP-binding protein
VAGFLRQHVPGPFPIERTGEVIEAYKMPDGGRVTALGLDPRKDGYELRERIGITLQETSVYPPHLRADELLRLSTRIP